MKLKKAAFSWSGGKDSAWGLFKAINSGIWDVQTLFTTISSDTERVMMHGISVDLLKVQCEAIGIPLKLIEVPSSPDNNAYENAMEIAIREMQQEGTETFLFGDLFLEDLKKYREDFFQRIGANLEFPIWTGDPEASADLLNKILEVGFKAIICSADEEKMSGFTGKTLSDLREAMPADIDPCGENGEYHTFCVNGSIFKYPVLTELSGVIHKNYEIKTENGSVWKTFSFADLRISQKHPGQTGQNHNIPDPQVS